MLPYSEEAYAIRINDKTPAVQRITGIVSILNIISYIQHCISMIKLIVNLFYLHYLPKPFGVIQI